MISFRTFKIVFVLPLSAILMYHNIDYHVYTDDTQLYILCKCKQSLEEISKLNTLSC